MQPFTTPRMLDEARRSPKANHKLIVEVLIFLLLMIISSVVQGFLLTPFELVAIFSDESFMEAIRSGMALSDMNGFMDVVMQVAANLPAWLMAVQLFTTVGLIGTVLVYCLKIEKRNAFSLGLGKKGAIGEYAAGLGIGLLLFSGAVGICCLTGKMTLSLNSSPALGWIICFFFGYLVQGFSEELLCRGYLMVSLSRGYPVWVCVLTNALLFAALHLANPGITWLALINLTLFGVMASLYTLRRGSLWGIAALHSIWNFAQGNLFGLSVSGMTETPSILHATVADGRVAELIHGGAFGPEGGLGVTIVLAIGALVLLFVPTKKEV